MKTPRTKLTLLLTSMIAMVAATSVEAKPLKVYILCGQSNMEGHAQTKTFPAVLKDPKTADLYKEIAEADGKPKLIENVWIAYSFGDFSGNPVGKRAGQLTSGFGSQHHVGTGKIGPELTFGIYTQKLTNEPILLIKNAWGGKSLMVDFRPPSAGEIADEKAKANAGKYYGHMMEHVKEVLADPKKVYPNYDAKEGYELAGFIWFQGFNDLVGNYPSTDPTKGKKAIKDYSEYSRLLSCFIRDVRKDLNAPKMPFVVGVLGVGGETKGDGTEAFRNAMAAPAETEEFKGNVANVFTHEYWPTELDAVSAKANAIKSEFAAKEKEIKAMTGDERKKAITALTEEVRKKTEATLTADELFLLDNGISNQGFHYWGSAKFFAQIGKAFAEAAFELQKGK